MSKDKTQKNLICKIASKTDIFKNTDAFKIYGSYKKTVDIVKRARIYSLPSSSQSNVGSTIDFEINKYGACSTTQKI